MSKNLIFPFVLIVIFLSSCVKKEKNEELPPSLREHLNFYIDREYWESGGIGCPDLYSDYYLAPTGGNPAATLVIVGSQCRTRGRLILILESVYEAGVYHLPEDGLRTLWFDGKASREDTINPVELYEYYPIKGAINITEFTLPVLVREVDSITGEVTVIQNTSGWVEGSFQMTLINDISRSPAGTVRDTVVITNGSFGVITR